MAIRVYKSISGMELFKKYFPDLDGFIFELGNKKGRYVCSCGHVDQYDTERTNNPVCECGNRTWMSCRDFYWVNNGKMSSMAHGEFKLEDMGAGYEKITVPVLSLNIKDKEDMWFEEETIDVASYNPTNHEITDVSNKSLGGSRRFHLNDKEYVTLFTAYPELKKVHDLFSDETPGVSALNYAAKIMNNPVGFKVCQEYPSLARFCSNRGYRYRPEAIKSFEDLCDQANIPEDLRDYWYVLNNRIYGIEGLRDIIKLKNIRPEMSKHLMRLATRNIVDINCCSNLSELLYAVHERIGTNYDSSSRDYRSHISWSFSHFLHGREVTKELYELLECFARDNIIAYGYGITEEFITRYKFLEENGIIPTDTSLSDKEYYPVRNSHLGGKPKFHEEVIENPLEAIKYW